MAWIRKEITTAVRPIDGRKRPRSEETRAKISAALKGRKVPKSVLAKRVASQTGMKRSPEFSAKLAERMRGKCSFPREAILKSAEKRRGKKLSFEHRAKLVESANRYPPEVRGAQRMITRLKNAINEK